VQHDHQLAATLTGLHFVAFAILMLKRFVELMIHSTEHALGALLSTTPYVWYFTGGFRLQKYRSRVKSSGASFQDAWMLFRGMP